MRVKITYKGNVRNKFDNKITKFMKKLGFEWYGQGYDLLDKERDIVFHKKKRRGKK